MASARLIPQDIQTRDVGARAGEANSHHIDITIVGGTARLTGRVSSCAERRAIERAVRDAPGVVRVENHLEVLPPCC